MQRQNRRIDSERFTPKELPTCPGPDRTSLRDYSRGIRYNKQRLAGWSAREIRCRVGQGLASQANVSQRVAASKARPRSHSSTWPRSSASTSRQQPGTAVSNFFRSRPSSPPEFRVSPADAALLLEDEVFGRMTVHDLPQAEQLPMLRAGARDAIVGGRLYDAHIAEVARRYRCRGCGHRQSPPLSFRATGCAWKPPPSSLQPSRKSRAEPAGVNLSGAPT